MSVERYRRHSGENPRSTSARRSCTRGRTAPASIWPCGLSSFRRQSRFQHVLERGQTHILTDSAFRRNGYEQALLGLFFDTGHHGCFFTSGSVFLPWWNWPGIPNHQIQYRYLYKNYYGSTPRAIHGEFCREYSAVFLHPLLS